MGWKKVLGFIAPIAALAIPGVGPAVAGFLGFGGGGAAATGMTVGGKLLLGSIAAQSATNLIGTKMQANAARRAGDIQSRGADRALDFEREQHNYELQRRNTLEKRLFDDYNRWLWSGEVAKLGELLGTGRPPPAAYEPTPLPRQTATINELRASGSRQAPEAASYRVGRDGPMIQMEHRKSHDRRWVPAARQAEYERQGAVRV